MLKDAGRGRRMINLEWWMIPSEAVIEMSCNWSGWPTKTWMESQVKAKITVKLEETWLLQTDWKQLDQAMAMNRWCWIEIGCCIAWIVQVQLSISPDSRDQCWREMGQIDTTQGHVNWIRRNQELDRTGHKGLCAWVWWNQILPQWHWSMVSGRFDIHGKLIRTCSSGASTTMVDCRDLTLVIEMS